MESAVGGLVKKAREKKGLTQTKAGRLLRISEQFIGRVEAGEVPLPFPRIPKFVKVLRIKKSDLGEAYVKDYTQKVQRVLNAKAKKR